MIIFLHIYTKETHSSVNHIFLGKGHVNDTQIKLVKFLKSDYRWCIFSVFFCQGREEL